MLKIEILSRGHDRDGFDCGSDPLNTYLRHTARQHIERGISRTFVLVEESAAEPKPIAGFFTLSGALPAEVPSGHQKELGNDAEAMAYADEHGFFDLPLIEKLIDRNTAPAPLARAREVFLGFNRLAAQELLATCRNADSLTELALAQFMEKLAPGRYHLAPKSLVAGCRSRADLEERIRRFRCVVPAS